MKLRDVPRPGDCLLYRATGLIGWIISVKTWHTVTHCEGYWGNRYVVAARGPQDGKGGVGVYSLREADLAYVLRPAGPFFDVDAAIEWFHTVDGQRYDLWGLLRFFTLGRQSHDKQFCSEMLTRWYRAGGFHPFAPTEDADLIAPGQFLQSPEFEQYAVVNGEVVPRA